MKAVFVHRDTILRDSHVDLGSSLDSWRLTPATLEAVRLLSSEDTLLLLWGSRVAKHGDGVDDTDQHKAYDTILKQVEAAGGRIDALVTCPHNPDQACRCWGDFPGAVWLPASQFGLSPEECYVLGDESLDVETAYAAGARPLIVLCGRSIDSVLGNLPQHKDFPIAPDLTAAVSYIEVENDITSRLGHARVQAPSLPQADVLFGQPAALPEIQITSQYLESLQSRVLKSRLQLQDIARWLTFFVLGAVGTSLGIAYMLTHMYRVQPFPAFAYWVTLQFISRPLRGALFIVLGLAAILIALRMFYLSSFFRQLTQRWRP